MPQPYRVVFDTNVFTRESFDLLERSPMRSLCKSGRVTPLYGDIFLEEMLWAYGGSKRRDLVERWLPFIERTVDRFCAPIPDILHRELVQGHGLKTNIFMPKRDQEWLLLRMRQLPLEGTCDVWEATKRDREQRTRSQQAEHQIMVGIRNKLAKGRKDGTFNPKNDPQRELKNHLKANIDFAGHQLLSVHVPCKNPNAVARRWARMKNHYPYFSTLVSNFLYRCHYSAVRVNDAIDPNGHADLNIMVHLLHADAVISNEQGFFRKAFDDLWRVKGKRIFTTPEFVRFLANL